MRLRRGGRKKETAIDSSAAATLADEPGPVQPPPSGSVLGLSTALGGEPAAPTDEWGLYDPDLAGVGALLSTLDTSAISFPDDLDQDPGELLIRHQASAAREPIESFPPVLASDAEEATHRSQVATAVASCRVPHLAPLSLWARVADADVAYELHRGADRMGFLLARQPHTAVARNGSQFVGTDLAAEIARLTHPALVAMTGLSPACRIRGIRTEPAAIVPQTADERPGWPQPEAAPASDDITIRALERLDGGADFAASPVQEQAPAETVAEKLAQEPLGAEPAATPETAQVCVELGVEPEAPLVVEPPPDADTAEDLGVIVAAPALDALPVDLMMDAPPEAETAALPDAAALVEVTPEPERWAAAGPDAPAPVQEFAPQEPATGELPPPAPAPSEPPPQVVAPPAKKRRRTALALG